MRGFLLVVLILGIKTMSAQTNQVDIRNNYEKIFGVEILEFGDQKFPKPTVAINFLENHHQTINHPNI